LNRPIKRQTKITGITPCFTQLQKILGHPAIPNLWKGKKSNYSLPKGIASTLGTTCMLKISDIFSNAVRVAEQVEYYSADVPGGELYSPT